MKKIVKYIFVIMIISLCFNNSVFSYEIPDESVKNEILQYRQEIYDTLEYYQGLFDETEIGVTTAHYGKCAIVKVDGKSYTLEEYIAGVVKHEIGSESDKPETLKAQAIAARSYLLTSSVANGSECTVTNSQSFQTFSETTHDSVYYKAAEETAGMVVTINGETQHTQYLNYPNAVFTVEEPSSWTISFQRFAGQSDTEWTWVGPSKDKVLSYSNYASPTGAPSTSHHYGMSQNIAAYLEKAEGFNYEQILKLFYGDNIVIAKISDGSYVGNLEVLSGMKGEFKNIYYFNQQDYSEYYLSSNPSVPEFGPGTTIKDLGCGPTSLAMVVSSLLGEPHGPIETTEKVCSTGGCVSYGTDRWWLGSVAESYGLKVSYVNGKDNPAALVSELSSGNTLAIALMGPGTFTNSAHFIVLTGYDGNGNISVADPWSRDLTNIKWFDINTILGESSERDFLVIRK